MEHWRIAKQKFSNKKNYFKKEIFGDEHIHAFAVLGCNFIQNMSSAKSLCLQNFSKLVIMTKRFSKLSTYSSYFKKFLNCLLYVRILESRMF